VVVVWEYDDREAYERINSAVVADPASGIAQKYRATLGPLFTEREEAFMKSTAKPRRRVASSTSGTDRAR
jgi:predicted GNAT superfamily acetyltransferase